MFNQGIHCPSEADEQRNVMEWAELQSPAYPELRLLFHIPNGGSRDVREARNLKLQGVKSGVPDLMLPAPRGKYHGLFIEMKRQKNGRVSDNQREWLEALTEQGYRCEVCRGGMEAVSTIKKYLKGELE